MEIIQRGNPGLVRSIQKAAKDVSKAHGIALEEKPIIAEGGAFASLKNNFGNEKIIESKNVSHQRVVGIKESPQQEKRLKERLLESVETLSYNKEYFNATSSLFTLYSMGELTEGTLNTLSREDLREIKGIIKEFKETLERF